MVPAPSSAATRRIVTAARPSASAIATAAAAICSRLNRGLRPAGSGRAQTGPREAPPAAAGTQLAYIVPVTEYAVLLVRISYALSRWRLNRRLGETQRHCGCLSTWNRGDHVGPSRLTRPTGDGTFGAAVPQVPSGGIGGRARAADRYVPPAR